MRSSHDSQGSLPSGPEPLAVAETTAAPPSRKASTMLRLPADGPAPIDASLHLLADHLVDALIGDDLQPSLLHVSAGDATGFDLGMAPLDGRHPSELLIGQVAPPEWHALGVATGGWAYHRSDRGRTQRQRTRVSVVTLVSRSGEVAHRTRFHDPEVLGLDVDGIDEAPGGEQIDLLRLALSLPTAPPPCGTDVYWAIVWLSEILGVDADRLQTWDDVAALHPAMAVLRRGPRPESGPDGGELVEVVRAFRRVFTWEQLREMLVDDRFDIEELAPSDGAWFDDGSFARFLLNRCPPLPMLRRDVGARLPHLAPQVLATLDQLDIPEAAWPDDRAA